MEKVMNPRKGSGYLLNEMLFPFVRDGYEDLVAGSRGCGSVADASDYFCRSARRTEDRHSLGVQCARAGFILFGIRSAGAAVLAMDAARANLRPAFRCRVLQTG